MTYHDMTINKVRGHNTVIITFEQHSFSQKLCSGRPGGMFPIVFDEIILPDSGSSQDTRLREPGIIGGGKSTGGGRKEGGIRQGGFPRRQTRVK